MLILAAERTGRGSWGASDQTVLGRRRGSGISVGRERIKGKDGRRGTDEAAGGIMLDSAREGVCLVSPGPGMLWALPGVGWVIGSREWFSWVRPCGRLHVCDTGCSSLQQGRCWFPGPFY